MTAAYVIRAAGPADMADVLTLRDLAGPGFTSLAVDDGVIAARLAQSQSSFAADVREPSPQERYILALEHRETGRVVGMAAVKAAIGHAQPFYNFRVLRIAQSSAVARRRFDMDVLILVNEFTGCSEVGSLFVRPEHRAGGVGRALAQTRYLLMAAGPHRFSEVVVSELRGVVGPDGHSPFWETLGRRFFRMTFEEADRMSAVTDNQFILDLMPKYPIYVDLLDQSAQAVIGKCHAEGEGARKLLEWEGYRYADVIDIFDGGPLMRGGRDSMRTAREARRLPVYGDLAPGAGRRGLVARTDIGAFRCAPTMVHAEADRASVSPSALAALDLGPGSVAQIWVSTDAA